MTLTGEAAERFAAEVKSAACGRRAEQLALAKADAARRGKEPFDLEKLEALCDTSREGKLDPVPVRRARLEELYLTGFPEVMTLAELARKIDELGRW